MEQLPQSASDATSVEPDGYIKIVFKSNIQAHRYNFKHLKHWGWKAAGDGLGKVLVVVGRDGNRVEFPELGVLCVEVFDNSNKYMAWKAMEDAAAHVIELQHHLDQAQAKFDEKRKEFFRRWPVTS